MKTEVERSNYSPIQQMLDTKKARAEVLREKRQIERKAQELRAQEQSQAAQLHRSLAQPHNLRQVVSHEVRWTILPGLKIVDFFWGGFGTERRKYLEQKLKERCDLKTAITQAQRVLAAFDYDFLTGLNAEELRLITEVSGQKLNQAERAFGDDRDSCRYDTHVRPVDIGHSNW